MDVLNAEFARLLESSGWRQSEAAKHLELSPAVITRYLNRDTRPSLTVLKLFKLLIGDIHPLPGDGEIRLDGELKEPLDLAETRLLHHLRALPEPERRRVMQAFCCILAALKPADGALDGALQKAAQPRRNGKNGRR